MRSSSPTRSVRDTDKIVNNRSDGDLFVGSPEYPDHVRYEVSPVDHEGQAELPASMNEVLDTDVIETDVMELDGTERAGFRTCGWSVVFGVLVFIFAVVVGVLMVPEPSSIAVSSPTDPTIAVVGATGAGKSSFIEALGGRDANGNKPSVGHSLESCKLVLSAVVQWLKM